MPRIDTTDASSIHGSFFLRENSEALPFDPKCALLPKELPLAKGTKPQSIVTYGICSAEQNSKTIASLHLHLIQEGTDQS